VSSSKSGISQIGTDQFHAKKEYVGNTLWTFGKNGVHIYSPDGSVQHRFIDPEVICGPVKESNYTGGWSSSTSCRFSDIVSDGKKYVWAAVSRGVSTVDVFDIDSGAIIGSFATCKSPNSLEYHALREEIWVRCSDLDVESTDPTHLDVLSATNPSGEIQTNILVDERALRERLSSSGYSVINDDLGDVGYITDDAQPYLFKVDLSTKKITDRIEMTSPKPHGLYEAAYSKVNGHVYARAIMCCTCGTPESDKESCGKGAGSPVHPTTGSSA